MVATNADEVAFFLKGLVEFYSRRGFSVTVTPSTVDGTKMGMRLEEVIKVFDATGDIGGLNRRCIA